MILNLHKPIGWTSFDVVKKIRSITNEKKVGHAGTLDPFAEGVLILGTGKDTKILSDITKDKKTYEASLLLGMSTNTLDTEGDIVANNPVPILSEEKITDVLNSFIGDSLQIPPMFSAKKINGQRLYKLARKNITIEREPHKIKIFSISLLSYIENVLSFVVTCSKGTYVRVLGKDIAERLNTIGHLTRLIRTKVGKFSIEKSLTIEKFQSSWKFSEV